jgi:hypothetical protein
MLQWNKVWQLWGIVEIGAELRNHKVPGQNVTNDIISAKNNIGVKQMMFS